MITIVASPASAPSPTGVRIMRATRPAAGTRTCCLPMTSAGFGFQMSSESRLSPRMTYPPAAEPPAMRWITTRPAPGPPAGIL